MASRPAAFSCARKCVPSPRTWNHLLDQSSPNSLACQSSKPRPALQNCSPHPKQVLTLVQQLVPDLLWTLVLGNQELVEFLEADRLENALLIILAAEGMRSSWPTLPACWLSITQAESGLLRQLSPSHPPAPCQRPPPGWTGASPVLSHFLLVVSPVEVLQLLQQPGLHHFVHPLVQSHLQN